MDAGLRDLDTWWLRSLTPRNARRGEPGRFCACEAYLSLASAKV